MNASNNYINSKLIYKIILLPNELNFSELNLCLRTCFFLPSTTVYMMDELV
jgi:hypothetical protein